MWTQNPIRVDARMLPEDCITGRAICPAELCGWFLRTRSTQPISIFSPAKGSEMGRSSCHTGFVIWANKKRHTMTVYSWKSEAPVGVFHILTSRQQKQPTQVWVDYFKEGNVEVWWERKHFFLTMNLKIKKTLPFSCWLGNSHFSIFLLVSQRVSLSI